MKTYTGIPKFVVYALLILCATIPLFFDIKVPGKPVDPSVDAFKTLMTLKEGSTVLIASDWTGSTRGESKAQMLSILKILMRKNIKFALYSSADPQSPRVAQDVISGLNEERAKDGEKVYARWTDWVLCGFYPNSDVVINSMNQDVRKMLKQRRDTDPAGKYRSVIESPVLENIKKITDFSLVINITASKTSDFHVQFMSASGVPLLFAVTGVMVPETQVFYNSGQVSGFLGGLKGCFDLEQMMEKGLNVKESNGIAAVTSEKVTDEIVGFPGKKNLGAGTKYYPTLHFTLVLMIVLIIIGNIEMIKAKKSQVRA
jgi:hypothetical protein